MLGAILLSRDALGAVIEAGLRYDDFYKPGHQHIFDVAVAVSQSGGPVDTITVADELSRLGLLEQAGGVEALHALQNATPAISNAASYAKIVQDAALLRRLILVAADISEIGYGRPDNVDDALDDAESRVFRVADRRVVDSYRDIGELMKLAVDRIEENFARGDTITGIATGFNDLDELLSGLQPSTLNIVGARPSMGKTAMGLGMATHVAKHSGRPVLVFSLEMGHVELTQRILSSEAEVDSQKIRNGRLSEADWAKIGRAIGRLEVPLFLDDNPRVTVMEIRAKARRLKMQHGDLGMILVDYLQLMSGGGNSENRQLEVSEISRNLKILARELEVPIVALSQLSRNLESRSDKRPMLSDLRESGCVTADTRLLRADTNAEVTIGELVASGARNVPVWSLDRELRMVPGTLIRAFLEWCQAGVLGMRLASGRTVKASANHPFLTIDGWKRLDELSVGVAHRRSPVRSRSARTRVVARRAGSPACPPDRRRLLRIRPTAALHERRSSEHRRRREGGGELRNSRPVACGKARTRISISVPDAVWPGVDAIRLPRGSTLSGSTVCAAMRSSCPASCSPCRGARWRCSCTISGPPTDRLESSSSATATGRGSTTHRRVVA